MKAAGIISLIGLVTLVTSSCTTVAPIAVSAGDHCFRCRRTISEVRLAAEMIESRGFVSKYRGAGCLAKYLVDHPDETATVFVTDYVTGRLVRPSEVLFVPIVVDRKTGEIDYRAYRLRADAVAASMQEHTIPVDWKFVLANARS